MAINFNGETQSRAAHVINVTEKIDASRVVLSNNSGSQVSDLWDMGTINKLEANSIIVCTGTLIATSPNNSGHVMPHFKLHNSRYRGGWWYNYAGGHSYACSVPIGWSVTGETATGNIGVKLEWGAGGGGGEKPFGIVNANQNDDGRMSGGVYSRAMIWEVLL
jgi:hypothetical protein